MAERRSIGAGWTALRIGGIPIVFAPSWALAAILITVLYADLVRDRLQLSAAAGYAVGFSFAVLLAVSVLLHELGHCLVSVRLGIPVRRVVLFLLGGVSEIERNPARPRDEFLVALAGPLVSVALAGLGIGALAGLRPAGIGGELLFQLTATNVLVAAFNLLPGLPLDGGRLLRAGLWRLTGSHLGGTRAAAIGGRIIAVGVLAGAIFLYAGPGSIELVSLGVAVVMAFVLWSGAGQSLVQARAALRAEHLTVAELTVPAAVVPADRPLSEALRLGDTAALVTDSAGTLTGVLDLTAAARSVAEKDRPWTSAGDLATGLGPGQTLADSLGGEDLLAALRAHPAALYAVVGRDGDPVGVLRASDLAAALTAVRRPVISRGDRAR